VSWQDAIVLVRDLGGVGLFAFVVWRSQERHQDRVERILSQLTDHVAVLLDRTDRAA